MRSALVLLERCSLAPKEVWRSPSFSRTLTPIQVDRSIINAWQSNWLGCTEQVSVVVSLGEDGSPNGLPFVHPIEGQQKDFIGVFDVSFTSADRVEVILREEQCASKLGSPKRRTRLLAVLRPWKPVRVLLNGRFDGYSGQNYLLLEYHLALCTGGVPDRLEPPRFVDLQADLF